MNRTLQFRSDRYGRSIIMALCGLLVSHALSRAQGLSADSLTLEQPSVSVAVAANPLPVIIIDPDFKFPYRATERQSVKFTIKVEREGQPVEDKMLVECLVDGKRLDLQQGAYTWVPTHAQALQNSTKLSIKVIDSNQAVLFGKEFNFVVSNIDQSPVFDDDKVDVVLLDMEETLEYDFHASDPDGDELVYKVDPEIQGLKCKAGVLSWKFKKELGLRFPQTLTLTVCEKNDKKRIVSKKLIVKFKNKPPAFGQTGEIRDFEEGESMEFFVPVTDANNLLANLTLFFNDRRTTAPVGGIASILRYESIEEKGFKVYCPAIPYDIVKGNRDTTFYMSIGVTDSVNTVTYEQRIKILDRVDPRTVDTRFSAFDRELKKQIDAEDDYNRMWGDCQSKYKRRNNTLKAISLVCGGLAIAGTLMADNENDKAEKGEDNHASIVAIAASVISVGSLVATGLPSLKEARGEALIKEIEKSDLRESELLTLKQNFIAFLFEAKSVKKSSYELKTKLMELQAKLDTSIGGLSKGKTRLASFPKFERFERKYQNRKLAKSKISFENNGTLRNQ